MKDALALFLLLAFCGCLSLIVFTSLRQDRKKATYFMMATIALGFYVFGYLVEVMATTREAAIAAIRIENAGIPLIAPCFLWAMISLFHPSLMRKWMIPATLAYGLAMTIVVLLNERHGLYYTSITMVPSGGGAYFAKLGHGPLYALQQVVSMSCVLLSYAVVFRRYVLGTPKLRGQMRLMIVGSAISLAANILNFTGALPNGLDPTPFAMTVSMGLFAFNLMQYRLMDLVPIASSSAVWAMEDAVIVLDEQRALQYWNGAAVALFPSLASLSEGDPVARLRFWPAELWAQTAPGEVTFCQPDFQGADRYYRARVSRIDGQRGQLLGWSYVCRDITDHVDMMRQLEELATTDPLTGIYNRRQFMQMVNHEMEVAARLGLSAALIMCDLDHFKDVNDTYGHLAGDYVLCAVADIVKNQLRPYDIFARYGGEEFVIFTTSNEPFDLFSFADRLRDRIARAEISYDGLVIPITASFGVAHVPPRSKFEDAMRAVDIALYRAKADGRNRVAVSGAA